MPRYPHTWENEHSFTSTLIELTKSCKISHQHLSFVPGFRLFTYHTLYSPATKMHSNDKMIIEKGINSSIAARKSNDIYMCVIAMQQRCFKLPFSYWRGIVPEDCARRHPDEKWKCYFGEYVFGTDSQSPKHSK